MSPIFIISLFKVFKSFPCPKLLKKINFTDKMFCNKSLVKYLTIEYLIFRIKNLIPKSGNEIIDSYNPLDLGLERLIDFSKGCYVGQEVIARLDTYKKVQNIMHMIKVDDIDSNMRGTKITSSSGGYAIAISKKKFV